MFLIKAAARAVVVVCVLGSGVSCAQTVPLSFRPVDAEYSPALKAIIFVASNPHELHIYRPQSRTDVAVALPAAPLDVSVGPTGLYAAVLHDGLISYVNLAAAAVERSFQVNGIGGTVLLASDNIYVPPDVTVSLSRGVIQNGTSGSYVSYITPGDMTLHPSGQAIYGGATSVNRYALSSSGIAPSAPLNRQHAYGPMWSSADGKRLYTGGEARVLTSSPAAAEEEDLRYWGTLPGIGRFGAFAESVSRKQIAVVPGTYDSSIVDNRVLLYNSDYLTPAGRFLLPPFVAGSTSYTPHARWLFIDDTSSALHVVMQADSRSGLTQDFALHTIDLSDRCTPVVGTTSVSAPGSGGIQSFSISAPATCHFEVLSDADWVVPVSGFRGTGDTILRFLVRPNPIPQARSATLRIGWHTISVQQSVRGVSAGPIRLPSAVVAAEYSGTRDRLLYVTSEPPELHMLNPVDDEDRALQLPLSPRAVSVRPDGLFAAVAHDGWISMVDLTKWTLLGVYKIETDIGGIVLAANGWVYAFPASNWGVYSLQLATGVVKRQSDIHRGTIPRLHPNGMSVYANGGTAPSDSSKWNIDSGPATPDYSYHVNACGNIWLSEDGARLFTACGELYRDVPEGTLYNGSFGTQLRWAAHNSANSSIAVIPFSYVSTTDTEVRLFGYETLSLAATVPLPSFPAPTGGVASRGQMAFWSSSGDKLFVLVRADPAAKLESDWAVVKFSANGTQPGCTITPASTAVAMPATGLAQLNVVAASGCAWRAATTASWLRVMAGGFGFGNGVVSIRADANTTASSRSAILTIGPHTVTVTQPGGGPGDSTPAGLAFRPVHAEYSAALDAIVLVSANPNTLYVYYPKSRTMSQVGLSKPPLNVAVSPNGLFAAVMHDRLVSYVNLASASVERTFPTTATHGRVLLTSNYVYLPPRLSINLSTGAVHDAAPWADMYKTAALHPSGTAIYGGSSDSTAVSGHDILSGTFGQRQTRSYSVYVSGNVWASGDGKRIYTSSGPVLSAAPADEQTDLRYWAGFVPIEAFAESNVRRQIAVALRPNYGETTEVASEILFFNSDYLNLAARFRLPPLPAAPASYAHARWIFFDSSSQTLYAVVQAASSAGLLEDFAVQTIPISQPAPCTPSSATASVSVTGSGAIYSVVVTAPPTCQYRTVTNADWVELLSGFHGSGNGTLRFLVRPNASLQPRTAAITIGSHTVLVTQSSRPSGGPIRLPAPVIDAKYSKALDRLVYVTAEPAELHILDPVDLGDKVVRLPVKPQKLSIRPDGLYAAVGHDGWISIVNLETAAFLGMYKIEANVADLLLGSNGWIYAFRAQGSDAYSLQLSTGIVKSTYVPSGNVPRLHPNNVWLYLGGFHGESKWTIGSGELQRMPPSFSSSYDTCGNLWLSEDGGRIFTVCGSVYRTAEGQPEDLSYVASLQTMAWFVADSAARQTVAVIPTDDYYSTKLRNELRLYGSEYLEVAATVALPPFPVTGTTVASQGQMAFWNKAADRLFVLVQADPLAKLESDWALVTFSGDGTQAGCTITPGQASVSMPSSGIAQFGVTSGSGCAWTAASDAAWLTVTGGGFGFGTGTVMLRAASNTTGATRSATVTVGSQLVTVTQAAPCQYSLSGPAVFSATGGTGTVTITAGAGCPWTAATLGAPVTLTSPVSGSGTGTVGFQIAANTGNTIQFGRIAAGGQVFTITVRPAGYQPRFVFQNRTTNAVSSWLMGGTGSAAILQSPVIYTAAANWRVAAFADFNTDGIPDVVLQNRSTGAVSIWYMGGPSGMTIVSAPIIHTAYAGWNVAGAADLDNNGIADIVLQNATSNAISVWYLGAGAQLQSTPIIGTPLLNWRVAANADFDGNGTPDLVLQNVITNGISIWYMGGAQGSTMLRAPFIRTAAAGWIVAGAAFLDGNTTPDLVLHNPTTGGVSFWYMGNSGESLLNAPIVAWAAANWSLPGGQ